MKPELLDKLDAIALSAFEACVDTDVTMWQLDKDSVKDISDYLKIELFHEPYNKQSKHYSTKAIIKSKDGKRKASFTLHSSPF